MYPLSPEEEKLVERARSIARNQILAHSDRVDETGEFPHESINALGQAGLLGLTVPSRYGGMEQGNRVACAVLEEIARCCASTAMIYLMHLCGIACYAAAPDKTARYLTEAAKGRHLTTLAFSEKGSRSHFWAPVSQVLESGPHLEISADKSWVTSAGQARGYVVSSRSAGATDSMTSSLYLVLAEDPGVQVSGPWKGLGLKGNGSCPMKLDKVRVTAERALSHEGKGLEMMLTVVLPVFQVGVAAISIGLAEAAVQATTRHLTGQRFEHLDSRLADLPVLRARLARMRIETDRSRAHLVAVLNSLSSPDAATQLLVLEVKTSASDTALQVTDLGMKACGGAAFSRHLGLERFFRDARAAVVMAPTTDQAHDFIGRALCGMELF